MSTLQRLKLFRQVLRPHFDNSLDLGSLVYRFKNLYLSGVGSMPTLNASNINGSSIAATNLSGTFLTVDSATIPVITGSSIIVTQSARIVGIASTGMTVNSMNANIFMVGGGPFITGIISSTYTLDFPSTAALTSTDLTVGFSGVITNDTVMLGIPSAAINSGSGCDNCLFSAWVVSNGAISIRLLNNHTVTAADPSNGTYRITVIRI